MLPTIKISNLNPTGSELFSDSENYLTELTDEELNLTGGIIIGLSTTNPFPTLSLPVRPTIPTFPTRPFPSIGRSIGFTRPIILR
ncbi:hypothetical protein [Nodularia sp. UHCC 0506]|uniref:hypothetical protein n=1 Tax=Nodularia sp. UHCC 0506 TaxID=3110243 RepID=UPI002B1EF8B5|nr:hypothetical protein [Nodularia sp. UHCC 0506]MEA5516746.1 hypothetical protein [Nodularia sp. UHCC 0506]